MIDMCQDCINDGLISQDTYSKIQDFLDKYPDAEWGPAHIVLSDYNVFDDHLRWCLSLCKAALSRNPSDLLEERDIDFMDKMDWYASDDRETLERTKTFLEELLVVPEDIR